MKFYARLIKESICKCGYQFASTPLGTIYEVDNTKPAKDATVVCGGCNASIPVVVVWMGGLKSAADAGWMPADGFQIYTEEEPVPMLIAAHAKLLETNPYAYFELGYTRQTMWMAWICTHPKETHPDRKVLASGQGETPEEACAKTLEMLKQRGIIT